MDYSKKSDAEINLQIAHIFHPGKKFTLAYSFGQPDGPMVQWIHGYGEFLKLDYCNSPADAWPIIVENRLYVDPIYASDWSVSSECDSFREIHKNPLRAAMIVFLMIQDSANVPADSTGSDLR